MEFYVTSCGYADNDALAVAIATTSDASERAVMEIEREERISWRNERCDETCTDSCAHIDDFDQRWWWSGPVAEKPLWTMHNVLTELAIRQSYVMSRTFAFDDLRAGVAVVV